jgi:hypothetical protein
MGGWGGRNAPRKRKKNKKNDIAKKPRGPAVTFFSEFRMTGKAAMPPEKAK